MRTFLFTVGPSKGRPAGAAASRRAWEPRWTMPSISSGDGGLGVNPSFLMISMALSNAAAASGKRRCPKRNSPRVAAACQRTCGRTPAAAGGAG